MSLLFVFFTASFYSEEKKGIDTNRIDQQMRVLQICNKPPFPEVDGGTIAMSSMTKSMLKNGYELTVLSMISFKHSATKEDIPEPYREQFELHLQEVDLRIKPLDAFLNLFSDKSYHVERFISKAMENTIEKLLSEKDFDIIQLETVFITPYLNILRKKSKAKIVLRVHNIEYEVWQTTAHAERNIFKKMYLSLLAHRLKKFELNVIKHLDGIITISFEDQKKLKNLCGQVPVTNIPLGVNLKEYTLQTKQESQEKELPDLFHLGAMDWIPNQVAMRWFLDNVWMAVVEKFPAVKFYIGGRKMPQDFLSRKSENLIVEGEVADASKFRSNKQVMIVPLLSGSGLRIKIIEGMALGKTIISTAIGATGIDYENGKDIIIANTVEDFINGISKCLADIAYCRQIGTNARKLAEKKYSLETTAKQLDNFYNQIRE